MGESKKIRYLLTMVLTFLFALCLFVFTLFAPLDRIKALGGGELSRVNALHTKIVGLCIGLLILVFSAFKIYQLYTNIIGKKKWPGKEKKMKKLIAFLSSGLMFAMTFLISTLLISLVWPYSRTEITVGALTTNIAGLAGLVIAALAATHTFRASLKSKTGRLYRKKEKEQ